MDPCQDRFASLLRDLELQRPLCLLLHDHGASRNALAMADVADSQRHEIARPKFAVDREVEEGELPHAFPNLQADADSPNFL